MRFRLGLISDLGGESEITAGKAVAINRATGILWELAEIDAYEVELTELKGSIVNKQTRSLPPVIMEKHRLEETWIKLMDRIYEGTAWKRVPRDISALAQALQAQTGKGDDDTTRTAHAMNLAGDMTRTTGSNGGHDGGGGDGEEDENKQKGTE